MVKKIAIGILAFLLGTILLGFGISTLIWRVIPSLFGLYEGSLIDYSLLFRLDTYLYGAGVCVLAILLYFLFKRPSAKSAKKMMKGKAENFDSNLENSRFMTEKEKDFNFTPYKFTN